MSVRDKYYKHCYEAILFEFNDKDRSYIEVVLFELEASKCIHSNNEFATTNCDITFTKVKNHEPEQEIKLQCVTKKGLENLLTTVQSVLDDWNNNAIPL